MDKSLSITKTIQINASPARVWQALTDPEQIKEYMFGTQTLTDWKVGEPIVWQGEWEGTTYKDQGTLLAFEPNKRMQYSYWSSFWGELPPVEDHTIITTTLEGSGNETQLTLHQLGFRDQASYEREQDGWYAVLERIKSIAERD